MNTIGTPGGRVSVYDLFSKEEGSERLAPLPVRLRHPGKPSLPRRVGLTECIPSEKVGAALKALHRSFPS